jgi:two-component system, sensor histidine kinase ChiS
LSLIITYNELKKIILLSVIILFIFQTSQSFGQSKLDSLHHQLNTKSNSDLNSTYLELAFYYKSLIPDSAIFYAKKTIINKNSFNDKSTLARSYGTLGEIYQLKAEFKESIEYYLKAIEIAEKQSFKTSLGSFYNGIGISFFYINDLRKAENYIKKAIENKLEIGDHTYYSIITTNLANIYFHYNRFEDAINLLKNAESTLINLNQSYYLSSLYNSLGGVYQIGKNNMDSAEFYYLKSLDIALSNDILQNIISGYHNLGTLFQIQKKYPKSIEYLKLAEKYSLKSENKTFRVEIFNTLSSVYKEINDFKNAYFYKNLQLAYKDSIFQTDKQKAIEELELKFQTAKTQQQIEIQKRELQETKLVAEMQKNQTYIILLIGGTLLLLALFIIFYFIQKKKTTELLEKEKSKIFQNIVHEIRTPLTLINGPLNLLKEKLSNDSDTKDNFSLIEQNSEKLVNLVNELLDASKLEKGKYHLEFKEGDINAFIDQIMKGFESESKLKNINLLWNPSGNKHHIKYPSNAIEKIVSNIIGNAIKYCPPNSTIKVLLKIETDFIVINISDNGPGIPENEKEKIFERFYRLKSNHSVKGTGIGLSLVKDLIELLNGKISVKSSVNFGTTFEVKIPFEYVYLNNKTVEYNDSKPLLLVVDDEDDILKLIIRILNSDFNIITANNGEDGLKLIREQMPDLVLTDVMMPVLDGLEMLHEIKTNELINHIPVIVFSAKSSLENRLKGLTYGADIYLPKPFYPEELKLVTRNLSQTIKNNQKDFQHKLKSEKTFEERINSTNEYVNKAISHVIKNISDDTYSVNELANDLCISRSQLHRKLISTTGFSATNFIRMIRLEKAKDLLLKNWGNVTEIAYECGFNSQSYFTKSFTEYFGESPSKFYQK